MSHSAPRLEAPVAEMHQGPAGEGGGRALIARGKTVPDERPGMY